MRRTLPAILTSLAATIFGTTAVRAAGPDFGYVYTTAIEEPGETEVSLWATDRGGKGMGHYSAQDYRLEFERGITGQFQASGYLTFTGHSIRGLAGEFEPVRRDLAFSGAEAEFKYQFRDPRKKSFGLAVYVEPGWSRISKLTGEKSNEYELELKAIVQKNMLADRLVWVADLTFEPEWEREREEVAPGVVSHKTKQELGIQLASGLSYQLAPRLWVGAEGRYHSIYPDWAHGLHRENYAVYAGPSVHYDGGKLGVTATWQPQLFGGPSERGSSLELEDHEKREWRVKLSYEL